jgi:four helix bundle protein
MQDANKKIVSFTDLVVWQYGHSFVVEIYKITKSFPKHEMYGIVSQLRRAASSVTSNIAEGFSRFSFKDKARFYYNSRGSLSECQNHILISKDVGYLPSDQAASLFQKADKIRQILNGLIKSTESRVK